MCGNFGLLLLHAASVGKVETLLRLMLKITQMRGAQSAGLVTYRSSPHKTGAVGTRRRVVNGKRTDLADRLLAAAAGMLRGDSISAPQYAFSKSAAACGAPRTAFSRQPCAVRIRVRLMRRLFQGHTRFATSSISDLSGCHPHQWTPPTRQTYWADEGTSSTDAHVECFITHNGDLDFFEWHGVTYPLDDVQRILCAVLHTKLPAGVDSMCVAGLLELLRAKGLWRAAVRYGYLYGVLKHVDNIAALATAGQLWSHSTLSRCAALFEQAWRSALEFKGDPEACSTSCGLPPHAQSQALNGGDSLLVNGVPTNARSVRVNSPKDALPRTRLIFAERLRAALESAAWLDLPGTTATTATLIDELISRATEAFLGSDLLSATRQLLAGAKGSFGLVTSHSLDAADQVVIASRGQTMSIAFYPQMGVVLFGSEAAATRAGMGQTIAASLLDDEAMEQQMNGSTIPSKPTAGSPAFARANGRPNGRAEASPDSRKSRATHRLADERRSRVSSPGATRWTNGRSAATRTRRGSTTGSDFGDLLRQSYRIDLDDVNGEVCLLQWGKLAPPKEADPFTEEMMTYGQGQTNRLLLTSHVEGNTRRTSIFRRLLQLDGNPLVAPPPVPVRDPVGHDVMDIPRIFARLQSDFDRPVESFNRLTAFTLASVLRQRFALHDEEKHDGAVDLLITGCEVSLWIGEQFAADMHLAFPKLKIVTLSANKLLGQLGQGFPIPQVNFAFHETTHNLTGTVCLLISHSGGTFATLACSNLLQSFTPHIFTVTAEWDTQVASAIRRASARRHQGFDTSSYVFTTFCGIRPAEPCTVSVAATHQLLTLIMLYLMSHMHTRAAASSEDDDAPMSTCGSSFTKHEISELALLNEASQKAIIDIVGHQVDDSSPILETTTSAALRQQGRRWAQHVLEGPISWILSAVYIAATVIAGMTPLSIIYDALEASGAETRYVTELAGDNETIGYVCTLHMQPILCDRPPPDRAVGWVTGSYVRAALDAAIYIFLPWWTTVLLRLVQRRPWLHRVAGRSLLIGDVPWVAQSVEAYVSKLFALSYKNAAISVASANPVDHLVHRHTHRVVRGGLLAVGRPDGRLNALTSAEATACLAVNQASSIQHYGVTCESVTLGHNNSKLPLTAAHLHLPGNRPPFYCEAELAAQAASNSASTAATATGEACISAPVSAPAPASDPRQGTAMVGLPSGRSPGALLGAYEDLQHAADSLVFRSAAFCEMEGRRKQRARHKRLSRRSSVDLANDFDGAIEKSDHPFIGAWMRSSGMDGRGAGTSPATLMKRQTLLQVLYEGRCASLERLVAFFVMFHAMGKTVQDFWPTISAGWLHYDMSKTHSIMRIATTASPVSGSEVRLRVLQLEEQQRRSLKATAIQLAFRMKRAKRQTNEELMQMMLQGKLTQQQLQRILSGRATKPRRAGISAETSDSSSQRDDNSGETSLRVYKKSDEVRARILSACRESALFAGMSKQHFAMAIDAMRPLQCTEVGGNVITQGDVGDAFYVIDSGEFTAHLKQTGDKEVRRYVAGGTFGELALMYDCPRAASVRCAVPGSLWVLERSVYRTIILRAGRGHHDVAEASMALVPQLLALTEAQRALLISEALREVQVTAGEVIVHEGAPMDALYLIRTGGVVFTAAGKADAPVSRRAGTKLQAPSHFGAEALEWPHRLDMTPRSSADSFHKRRKPASEPTWSQTVLCDRAHGTCTLLILERARLVELVGDLPSVARTNRLMATLGTINLLSCLSEHELRRLAETLTMVRRERGEVIVRQGEVGEQMFIVQHGTAKVTRRDPSSGDEFVVKEELGAGTHFGESVLLKAEPRSASVVATSEYLDLACITRASLEGLLGSLEVVAMREQARHEREAARVRASTFQLKDLQFVGLLGVGMFSRVRLVRHERTGVHYALKSMRKARLIDAQQVDHVLNEKQALRIADHPFCNSVVSVMRDELDVHILLEVALGGDLVTFLSRVGVLRDTTARFYSACVACALSHLHGHKIVHRDVKPENIILDADGYPKLTDFGFAKNLARSTRTWTLCGTPEYLAPEVITSQGHGFSVDWWAFGVLLYEMLVGSPPFYAETELATYQLICSNRVQIPAGLNSRAKELIAGTLVSNPVQRLGGTRRGDDDVLTHPYVRGLNLVDLQERRIEPPYVPQLVAADDLSHFEVPSDVEAELTSEDGGASAAAPAADGLPSRQRDLRRLDEAFSSL